MIHPSPQQMMLAALIAFVVSSMATWVLSRSPFVLDHPNHRSLHSKPIPRTGGIGLMLGVFAAWIVSSYGSMSLALSVSALMMISFLDDVRKLGALTRLSAHFVIAGLFFLVVTDNIGVPEFLVLVVAAVWMANLYNFMDGSDGLAAGMTLIGFSFYAFSLREHVPYAWASASIAMASLGFLIFNFNPAKIFLGDSGSIPLGFLAAALGYIGLRQNAWPWWYPVFVFSPFIVDASLTLAKRALRRERIWEAHKNHYYQRLIRMGWGHRKTALAEYGLMLSMGGVATLVLGKSSNIQMAFLMPGTVLYLGVALFVDRKWARHIAKNGNSE